MAREAPISVPRDGTEVPCSERCARFVWRKYIVGQPVILGIRAISEVGQRKVVTFRLVSAASKEKKVDSDSCPGVVDVFYFNYRLAIILR